MELGTLCKDGSERRLIQYCGYASKCGSSSIVVTQAKTGQMVEGKAQFQVTISNSCECPQSDVLIGCLGFNSVGPWPNPSIFRKLRDSSCGVNNGKRIVRGSPVKFTYAWDYPSDLPVVGARARCS
ncbi:hypothetical protein AMTRI_Chr06g191770 [Amborella trichopoda]|uniref:protein TAPETUM DETERMINANT 1-like n=1 Tax=Amborella trichopoda TaxID=13333 RepID=UPI0009C17D2B|nr:protein TAPETUM DETERMINANT 1-like [Amborella trichopoda]|eukprot:XP_020522913.1 protein TAPETUM DETERMINANT 1-like [Amborella trichopoda]